MGSKPTKRPKFGRKIDGKRHIWRELRCCVLGWHEESAFCSTYRWCWYCGDELQ